MIKLGDHFFMAVQDDYLDHHVDDSSTMVVEDFADEALTSAMIYCDYTQLDDPHAKPEDASPRAVVYACVPIGTVERVDGRPKVIEWAETPLELMARAAIAMGVSDEASGVTDT